MHICDRKAEEGPSSGTTIVGDDTREAVVRREASVWVDDFRARWGVVAVRVDNLPGMTANCAKAMRRRDEGS